jgi:hypothetical protein
MFEEQSLAGTKKDDESREALYQATRKELLAQQSSNAESYDKAVLTISAAFLGVSLAFTHIPQRSETHPLGFTV